MIMLLVLGEETIPLEVLPDQAKRALCRVGWRLREPINVELSNLASDARLESQIQGL